ncbi:MAG: transporter substrate-binding domain-containing protein [Planctomycetia bacterium]|nr:transporter substrate-binding domain-containing protein [Planctomycetia bacterium]
MSGERWMVRLGRLAVAMAFVVAAWQCRLHGETPAATPRVLRVAVTPIAAVVEWNGDQPAGVMIGIWEELARRLGMTSEFIRVKTFVDLMDMVRDGKADVALGPLAITEERERTLDLTHPIFHSGMRIAVRQRNETGLMPAVRSMLSWRLLELVAIAIALAVVSGHLLWWSEKDRNPRSFPPAYPRGVIEALWWIASTIVTGGCDDKHVDGPLGRILAFAWMIGGIGLIAAFTSLLTATMTAERVAGMIQGPRDLAGRSIGCQAASVSVQTIRQRGGVPQEYPTIHEALDALELGMIDAVVGEAETMMYTINESRQDRVKLVGPMFDSFDYGLALPSGSPLREELNTTILRMREDGTLARIKATWLGTHD